MGVPELSRAKMITLTLCFFLVFFIASDTLILSTASVSILNDLGGQQHYSLIFSIRGITIAVTCMLCGRLIDRMGRRNMLLFGLLIGLLSNVLGATAPNMLVLVVSRALYGLGYGFINAAVMIMINELFGKKSGYGYLITLIGYGVGNVGVPLLAGWLVENYTWRWGFWLLVASAVVCIALLVSSCPNYTMLQESNSKKLDVKGIIYSVLAISGLVGVLSFGGKSFAWLSLTTLVLVLFTIVMFVLFIRTEKNIDQNIAIFPVSMMRSKVLMGQQYLPLCVHPLLHAAGNGHHRNSGWRSHLNYLLYDHGIRRNFAGCHGQGPAPFCLRTDHGCWRSHCSGSHQYFHLAHSQCNGHVCAGPLLRPDPVC